MPTGIYSTPPSTSVYRTDRRINGPSVGGNHTGHTSHLCRSHSKGRPPPAKVRRNTNTNPVRLSPIPSAASNFAKRGQPNCPRTPVYSLRTRIFLWCRRTHRIASARPGAARTPAVTALYRATALDTGPGFFCIFCGFKKRPVRPQRIRERRARLIRQGGTGPPTASTRRGSRPRESARSLIPPAFHSAGS
jgi:hypothetical protein